MVVEREVAGPQPTHKLQGQWRAPYICDSGAGPLPQPRRLLVIHGVAAERIDPGAGRNRKTSRSLEHVVKSTPAVKGGNGK